MSDLELLRSQGDTLEKTILRLAEAELSRVLDPYSQIWAKHILTNRVGTGEFVKEPYQRFSENHYSALVRLYNAFGFLQSIEQICSECDQVDQGELLLKLQSYTAAFWWALGSTLENLGKAIEAYPGSSLGAVQDGGRAHLSGQDDYLKYIYSRRTQFIHYQVVPIGTTKGYPVSDSRYIVGSDLLNVPTQTRWQETLTSPDDIHESYAAAWLNSVGALASAWRRARQFLSEIKPASSSKVQKSKGGPILQPTKSPGILTMPQSSGTPGTWAEHYNTGPSGVPPREDDLS